MLSAARANCGGEKKAARVGGLHALVDRSRGAQFVTSCELLRSRIGVYSSYHFFCAALSA